MAFKKHNSEQSTNASNSDPYQWRGVLRNTAWAIRHSPDVRSAIATYDAASADQRQAWASAYEKALGTITPSGGEMEGMPSPDYSKIDTLKRNFGPNPTLIKADVQLAQNGYLEQYLQAVDPGHSYHLMNIWLYDHPQMLN